MSLPSNLDIRSFIVKNADTGREREHKSYEEAKTLLDDLREDFPYSEFILYAILSI
jgi:hypothetical protein